MPYSENQLIPVECRERKCRHRECDLCGCGHGSDAVGVDGLCHACREFWRDRDIRSVFIANCEALYCSYSYGGLREAATTIHDTWRVMKAEIAYFGLRMKSIDLPSLIRHLVSMRCTPACKYTKVPLSAALLGADNG